MRIFQAAVPALLFVALIGGASVACAAPSASVGSATAAAATPPATLKCKPPKVPTQLTVKGKTKWKCVKPATAPAAAAPPPPPPPPAAAPPPMPDVAPPPREPSN